MGKMGRDKFSAKSLLELAAVGLAAGFFSGMFGIGGGTIIVPGLIGIARFPQKLASGTSLAAIIPLAAVGVLSYAAHGDVAVWPAVILALGAMLGTQLGTYLLAKIPVKPLQLMFVAFLVFVIVMLFLVIPSRDATFTLTVGTAVAMAAVGFVTGVLAGLLGIGGGVVVVPVLIILFGFSDLVAKGTSLLMMIPAALAGTVSNMRRENVDLRAAAVVGLPACATTYLGSLAAAAVNVKVANILFAAFLVFVGYKMLRKAFSQPAASA